ncbi:hypothetical protein [Stenotrophomonas sp. PS02289]|uniref:hypothetical protein n=1 Tax=Stenotrophomonas sp. PS02289 TaxID=2991422 RepID=UPI00249CE17D|nr:hypothetical protein [Stenotrophomonas sp. PS02289]
MEPDYWRYHKATGCPVPQAKALFAEMTALWQQRVLQAIEHDPPGRLLSDPIERDPQWADIIEAARLEAEQTATETGHTGRGRCHVVWRVQADILAQRYGVVWFSPARMNPGATFD